MLGHYSASNGVFMQRLHELAGGLAASGMSAADAQTGALHLLELGLMRQAMTNELQ